MTTPDPHPEMEGLPAPSHTEVEAKLAVRSPDPLAVMEALAGLRTLGGGIRLHPRPTLEIRDLYLELERFPSHASATPAPRLALRRRRVTEGEATTHWLTLKGEDTLAPEGGVSSRFELEVPDHGEGRLRIREALAERGVQVGEISTLPARQTRETLRRRFHLLRPEPGTARDGVRGVSGGEAPGASPGAPAGRPALLAELCLDSVTLALEAPPAVRAGLRIRFHEVEIEGVLPQPRNQTRTHDQDRDQGPAPAGLPDPVAFPDPVALLSRLRDALLEVARGLPLPPGSVLVPWPLSKLETGLRIEALAASGALEPWLKDGGAGGAAPPFHLLDLPPEILDQVAAASSCGGVAPGS
jgi:hypothetical protein